MERTLVRYRGWKSYYSGKNSSSNQISEFFSYEPNIFDLIRGCRRKPRNFCPTINLHLDGGVCSNEGFKLVVNELQEQAFNYGNVSCIVDELGNLEILRGTLGNVEKVGYWEE